MTEDAQRHRPAHHGDRGGTATPPEASLLDRVLPRYHLVITHTGLLHAPPARCFQVARDLDLFRIPAVRLLLDLRALPNRLADWLTGRPTPASTHRTFRIADMPRPPINWLLLAARPDTELVIGQIAQPWNPAASALQVAPADFAAFDRPGYAKIAFGLRVRPSGPAHTILTMETRVAATDPRSLRRFRRYWLVIGPFSHLIRCLALRRIAVQLRRAPHHPQLT